MSADVTTIGSKPGRDKPKCLMEADIAALTAWNRTHKRGLEPAATPVPERCCQAKERVRAQRRSGSRREGSK